MNLETAAISSMNYLFLRVVNGDIDDDNVKEEVQLFIEALSEEHDDIDDDIRTEMLKEIIDGDYFVLSDIEDIERTLDNAMIYITNEPQPEVVRFYVDLVKEMNTLPYVE